MTRHRRVFGPSGYIHLIVRGIGKQILFEEKDDYLFYLSILQRFCTETSVSVLAYCLMENHVHLLVYDEKQNVPLLMKKLGVSYSKYYNRKYERSGHLFQDRYLSASIESETAILCVFRYILNNPQKAGICSASNYEWSSYSQYGDETAFTDTRVLRELIGNKTQYDAFLSMESNDSTDFNAEITSLVHDDKWAKEVIREYLNGASGTILQSMEREERNAALKELRRRGISVRQLERLTGISRGVIQKAR